jgi:LCP family protein required for cell wall assembly
MLSRKSMKKYSIEDFENNDEPIVGEVTPEKHVKNEKDGGDKSKGGKTPVNFKRKKKRSLKRKIILSVIVLLLAGIGWFGYTTWNSLKNIFAGGDAPSLLNLFDQKTLKGESSGRVNILLLGVGDKGHEGEGLSDTIMVVSLDVKTKNVAMISVPRDLYVKIDKYGYAKINAAHAYGEMYKYPGGGPQLAEETLSKVLDIPIHYYARVDFTGFQKIIDTVGGVDINVEKDLYDPLYPGDDGLGGKALYIKKGLQHMDGKTALRYARSRETTSDFDRAKRQQQMLVAVKTKVMSSSTLLNPKKMTEIIQILGNHIKTDFQVGEAQRAIELAKQVDTSKIINRVFDNGPDGLLVNQSSYETGYILVPRLGMNNFRELQDAVKNIFKNAYVTQEAAKISILNGTSKSGLATRLSERLKNLKYYVVNTGAADRTNYTSTVIYDYSNGQKQNTVDSLADLLDAKVEKKSGDGSSDIEIILGRDYQE